MIESLSVLLGHVDKYELDSYRGKGRSVYIHMEGRKDLGGQIVQVKRQTLLFITTTWRLS